jgi:predicted GNAT family acetyltransferase
LGGIEGGSREHSKRHRLRQPGLPFFTASLTSVTMRNSVHDNAERHRFELDADGHIAFSNYKREGGVITFMHTEVPAALNGRGIGSALVRGALDLARAQGLKVKALCPFVKAYLDKHPEYADLRAT